MTFESEILSEIKPSEEECAQIIANAEELKRITESYLEDNGINAKVLFAGSIGKGTFLRISICSSCSQRTCPPGRWRDSE